MRGQTTLDFAIGMSIFLVTVAFVVGFVPGMLQPFDTDSGEEVVAADRVADHLGRRLLAAAAQPFVLDASCTEAFFAGDDAADCRFDGDDPNDRMGLAADANVNVRIVGDADGDDESDVLCLDDGDVAEADEVSCSTPFEVGTTPPDGSGSVVVARRAVSVSNHQASLLVRMW